MIKPIETHYKGYRFRSRLEARWAVFFDSLKIEWQYEPEGFEINGKHYLPDFYLPEYKLYAEIKPCDQPQSVINLLQEFSNHNAIALFIGLPNDNPAMMFCTEADDGGGGSYSCSNVHWMTDNGVPSLIEIYDSRDRTFFVDNFIQELPRFKNMADYGNSRWDIEGVEHAVISARSARFEHGETP